jgi:two-component system NtrC family sensor kinase
LIGDILRACGYGVDMAPDGTEALRLCEQIRYDLILSDLRMPKVDGAALFRALQRRDGSLRPPVIFVTGQAYSPDYAGFLATASVPVVFKPFTADDLRKAVARGLAVPA